MKEDKPVTLRDVAAAANVGLATASRALRNDPNTSKKTAAHVKAVAKKIGYVPDPGLSQLIERRWRGSRARAAANLGFIFDSRLASRAGEQYQKYKAAAAEIGYSLIAEDIADFSTLRSLTRRIESQGIKGLVLSLLPSVPFNIDPLLNKYAAVSLGLSAYQPDCPVIMHDEFFCMQAAWQMMQKKGYGRIGLILPDYPDSPSVNMRLGAALVCRQHTKKINRIPVLFLEDSPDLDYGKFEQWMEKYQPDALLATTHDRADDLRAHGLRIPEDIPFATNNLWNVAEKGKIAGYFRNNLDLFEQGLQLLHMMIRSGTTGASRESLVELVKGRWVDGESLPDKS
jgi:LacI family transcriptional regulator